MKKAIILGFCVAANLSMVNIAQANDETGGRFLSQLTGSEQGSLKHPLRKRPLQPGARRLMVRMPRLWVMKPARAMVCAI
jgi:hypothetical protein